MTLPSIAAVVATGEPTYLVHWPASIRLQKPDKGKDSQELIDDLQAMVTKRLEHWRKKNGKLLEQVIIYRDGVSDGFYRLIKHYELAKIRLAFENVTRGYDPAMIYLVVLKRHPTRFFLSPAVSTAQQDHFTNPRLLDSRSNSKPGLLVRDTLTTRRDEVGYFLQSHECLKGTARPAHYLLRDKSPLHDDREIMGFVSIPSGFFVDHPKATHDFCYLFSLATRSVRVHHAIFYADLACGRARHDLHRVYHPNAPGENYDESEWLPNNLYKPHARLQNSMFYI